MATMKDVAKKAGVGVGTVSRVINQSGSVSGKTYEKVMTAIRELDYVPNEMARSLKTSGNKIVAIFLPRIYDPFFAELVFYIEDELDVHGYKLMVCNNEGNIKKELDYINMLRQKKVEGIIGVSGSEMNEHIDPSMPIVTLDRHLFPKMPVIASDNFLGGQIACQKLIDDGRRHLVYVGHTDQNVTAEWQKRKEGFVDICEKNNIDYEVVLRDDPIPSYEEVVDAVYEKLPQVDGIFAGYDLLALKLIKVLNSRNINIPDDISMIGFDGVGLFDLIHPQVSTIKQPIEQMARITVQSLIGIINGEDVKTRIILPIEYQKGETTRYV